MKIHFPHSKLHREFSLLLAAEADKTMHIDVDMEAEFSNLALDIIGLSVFNYDFGSVTRESPVIKAVYGTLFEAEHRSTFYIPYWKFPLARWLVPRQRKFHEDLKIINECLDSLIQGAKETRQVYNLHRSPYFWDQPHEFRPERFLIPKDNKGIEGWAGFDPYRSQGALYPNEVLADFAFLPFGGGPRKCVGDQFALMESTVGLAMLLQKFEVELKDPPESLRIVTGATIHTQNGLWCKIKRRKHYSESLQ